MFTAHSPQSRAQLRRIAVPSTRPYTYATTRGVKRWRPVQHGELADAFIAAVKASGLTPHAESWAVFRNRYGLLGSVELAPADAPYAACVGLRHSNDGVLALAVLFGARVRLGSVRVSVFGGDFSLGRRHSAALDLPAALSEGLARYKAVAASSCAEMVEQMTVHPLALNPGLGLLSELAAAEVYPWRFVKGASAAWRELSAKGCATMLGLYAAVSKAGSTRSEIDQLTTLSRLREHLGYDVPVGS